MKNIKQEINQSFSVFCCIIRTSIYVYGTSIAKKISSKKYIYIGKIGDTTKPKNNIYYRSSSNIMNHRHLL